MRAHPMHLCTSKDLVVQNERFFFQTHDNPWQLTCSPRSKPWYAQEWMLQPRIDENVKIKILKMTLQLWTCDYHRSAEPSPSTEHSVSGDCAPECFRLIVRSLKLGMYFLHKMDVECCFQFLVLGTLCGMKKCWDIFFIFLFVGMFTNVWF
jgi:hypothetical protein